MLMEPPQDMMIEAAARLVEPEPGPGPVAMETNDATATDAECAEEEVPQESDAMVEEPEA